jgi:hypothetical protein
VGLGEDGVISNAESFFCLRFVLRVQCQFGTLVAIGRHLLYPALLFLAFIYTCLRRAVWAEGGIQLRRVLSPFKSAPPHQQPSNPVADYCACFGAIAKRTTLRFLINDAKSDNDTPLRMRI